MQETPQSQLDALLTTNGELRPRVLHVLTRVAGGGAEDNTLYTCTGLSVAGFEVDLALGEENEPASIRKTGIDPTVRVFIVAGLRRNPSPTNEFRAIAALRRLIRMRGYHLVHTHGSKAGVLARIAAAKENVPIIVHGVHGISFSPLMGRFQRSLYRGLERWTARRTTSFICVGEDMRRKYLDAGIGTPEMYSVIHSGMNLDRFRRAGQISKERIAAIRSSLGIPSNATVIGMVSRMEARKQHELFLKAVSLLLVQSKEKNDGTIAVLLVGDGPREEEIRYIVRELNLESVVTFTGYRSDVETMFAISDIVTLTSKWEGLPRVLVQAAAVGRPVVTFDVDGVWEIVDDEVTGYIVPQGDTGLFAERLRRLVDDDASRDRMGIAAQTKVDDSWTIDSMVRDTIVLYRRLLDPLLPWDRENSTDSLA